MKQLLFVLTALVLAILPGKAQTSLVATLSHEGNITTFYSANALRDAYAAATDGDVITLSAGTFNATDISKRITMRGAGCQLDKNPTILAGRFEVFNSNGNLEIPLTIEGIRAEEILCRKLTNATFLKCEFTTSRITIGGYDSDRKLTNVNFIQCIISNIDSETADSSSFINCVINNLKSNSDQSSISINNCVINEVPGGGDYHGAYIYFFGITCTNSFVRTTNPGFETINHRLNTRFINSVYAGPESSIGCENINCKVVNADIDPFENGYHLKAQYASEWIGNDGTEIGIYGGSFPYDPTTTNPQISKFNVSPKTTADGKLSVDIEVKAE